MINYSNLTIEKVHLIDDDQSTRDLYGHPIDDMSLMAQPWTSIPDLTMFVNSLNRNKDAAICDYQLKTANYAKFNGDEVLARLYDEKIPALMCTKYSSADEFRHRLRWIPQVVSPNALSEQSIRRSIEIAIDELHNSKFISSRKPWRTMIRVESSEPIGELAYKLSLIVPGWKHDLGIHLTILRNNPVAHFVHQKVLADGVARVFGKVNLGAESENELYVEVESLSLQ